ncbi:MAG: metallophosphoesterase, partial [Planctomycetota bacterium]
APAPHKSPRRKRDRRPLKALQISDIHVDMLYAEGAEAECDEPLCCRSASYQLDANGTRRSVQMPAGRWGTLSKCDIPYRTLEHALEHLSTQHFDYIMWTGDLPAHDDWEQTRPEALHLLQNLTDLMLRHFPDTPVYPSLGNHESFPVNSFPPRYITEPDNSVSWLYDKLAEVWAPWLPEEAVETVRRYGYYTLLHRPGLRIVSLNMNYCNDLNFWTLVDAVDPDHHLRWLVDVLSEAERQGERVHIIGHIPPAVVSADCVPVWRNNYYRVIERFADTVVAQFFGHTHTDELELMFADDSRDRAFALGYVSPSLTTFIDLHPGYRVYDVAPGTWQIANHRTYIANLTKLEESGASEPEWELLYDARSAYGLPDLGVGSWLALWHSWTRREPDADAARTFQRYYRNYYKGNPPAPGCDSRCRWSMTCPIAVGNFTVECA